MKVETINYGIIHCHAGCDQCDFTVAMSTDQARHSDDVRRIAKTHVRETGHSVWVESGTHSRYEAVKEANGGK